MAGYGYTTPLYGAKVQKPQSLFSTPLVAAASGRTTANDPFGLSSGIAGTSGYQALNPFKGQTSSPTVKPAVTQAPVSTAAQPFHETPQQPGSQQAPTPATVYDVNTDPVLQQVNAYTNMSDAQARAAAMQQRRDAVLAEGDANLASSLFGETDPLVTATRNNPTSTLSRLSHQKDTTLHDLLNSLTTGGHNLGYSGYRTSQEGQVGNDYLQSLADAATGVNSNLGSIEAALAQALSANQQQRISGLQDAYGRMVSSNLSNPIAPTTDTSGLTDSGATTLAAPNLDLERLIRTTRTGPFKAA